jgi:hypothetical protein
MNRDTQSLFGITALACGVCCVGPILAVLGAIGIATIAGIAIFGIAAAAIALLAVPVVLRRRRHTLDCGSAQSEPVPVGAPTVRRSR